MKGCRLHVGVIEHLETEVKQCLILSIGGLNKGTGIETQLFEHAVIYDTVAIYKVTKQGIFLYRSEVLVANLHGTCARGV